jgi:ubiquinone/menaquinone biosynthesis C-methylase UbiE
MNLLEWQKNWDDLGKEDPLWAVLTDPQKKGGKWDPKEFFAIGEEEIKNALDAIKALGVNCQPHVALDFGCGVGRLSQALAKHFDSVHGVDISPSMIAHANRFNQFPGTVSYHLNSSNRLEDFSDQSIDFVYSNIALQHIEPRFSKKYLEEFMRVLRPGGIAVFQMISATFIRKIIPEKMAALVRKVRHKDNAYFGMFGVPERVIVRIIQNSKGQILDIQRTPFTKRWISMRFYVQKRIA